MLAVRSFSLTAASLSLFALTSAAPVSAQTTVFTDRATFTSATSGLTTINFNDQVPAGQNTFAYNNATTTQQGVTFTSNAGLMAISPTASPTLYGLGDGTVLSFQGSPNGLNILTVALPANTTAFGLNFGNFSGQNFTFGVNGVPYTFAGSVTATTTPNFVGFTGASAISGFTITVPGSFSQVQQIDRFSFGQANATAVPEPSEWAVIGMTATTLGGLMVRARRRKSIVAA